MKKPLQPPLIRIIDDDAQALEAVDFMLKCEGYSTVAYSSAAEFLVDDIPSRPGCLLSDIRMPDMMGTELFDELLNRNYPHPVLFMTAFGDIESAVTAMKKGAVDYLVKPVAAEKLFAGVVNALKIDRKRREGLVGSPFWSDRWASLTDREREVVKLVAKRLMSRQIAIELDISQRTVEVHRASGLKKLQIQTPAQAALVLSEIEDQNRTL